MLRVDRIDYKKIVSLHTRKTVCKNTLLDGYGLKNTSGWMSTAYFVVYPFVKTKLVILFEKTLGGINILLFIDS